MNNWRTLVFVGVAGASLGLLLGSTVLNSERWGDARVEYFYDTMIGHLGRLDASAQPGRVVFLGSSTLQALDTAAVTPVALNLAIGGDTLDGLVRRARTYKSLQVAKAAVLNIGFNDVRSKCLSIDSQQWSAVLALVAPQSPVVTLALQKASAPWSEDACRGTFNALILKSNLALKGACAERTDCVFVDNPVNVGADEDGVHLQANDGVHLSPDGYAVLTNRLRQALGAAMNHATS